MEQMPGYAALKDFRTIEAEAMNVWLREVNLETK